MEQWPCHLATREPGAREGGRSRHPGPLTQNGYPVVPWMV